MDYDHFFNLSPRRSIGFAQFHDFSGLFGEYMTLDRYILIHGYRRKPKDGLEELHLLVSSKEGILTFYIVSLYPGESAKYGLDAFLAKELEQTKKILA